MFHPAWTVSLVVAIAIQPACTRRSSSSDDDSDDDSTTTDDDTTAGGDDDSTSGGDDDATPIGDDDTTPSGDDDDDSTPSGDDDTADPFVPCAQDLLVTIQNLGALDTTEVMGSGTSQQLYSCETYQLQDVVWNADTPQFTASGNLPAWSLSSWTAVRLADMMTPAHLVLTGCNPYTCNIWTNPMTINVSVSLLMTEVVDGNGQHSIDIIFGVPSHNFGTNLLSNFQLDLCSLGNLNEDLQANGVDIFSILVPDVVGLFDQAISEHLAEVEATAEAQSVGCWP